MDGKVAGSMRELLERRTPAPASERTMEAPIDDEYVAFANGRVSNRLQPSLVFRLASGAAYAYSYTFLFSVESENPDIGFTLHFSGKTVVVRGRGLAPLFDSVCLHRAAEITEVGRADSLQANNLLPIVNCIEIGTRIRRSAELT